MISKLQTVFAVLLGLKLTGWTSISWLVVFAPLWGHLVAALFVSLLVGLLGWLRWDVMQDLCATIGKTMVGNTI